MTLPRSARIVEVGPRDGLQNEAQPLPTEVKLEFIDRLSACGLGTIEATSFVSPKWVPQLADHAEVMARLARRPGVAYPALVPNERGLDAALAAGAREIAVFAAASEAFARNNLGCSVAESLARFRRVVADARRAGVGVRGYVACALGCPYQGEVRPAAAAEIAGALYDMGCHEISLGDTVGVGTPGRTRALIETVGKRVPLKKLAGHFHDTYGMAAANIFAALELGVAVFDAAAGGIGGCPYAAGASGNVATEDLVWLMQGLGIDTGVDLDRLVDAGAWICARLGRETGSKAARALLAKRTKTPAA